MPFGRYSILLVIGLTISPLRAQQWLPPEVFSMEEGLSSRSVTSLAVDHDGLLWVGTTYGLNRYNGYRFRHFFTRSAAEEFGQETIHAVRCDNQGNIWVLTHAGINRFDRRNGSISRFSIPSMDTAAQGGYSFIDACPGRDNTFWVLSDNSLSLVVPGQQGKAFALPPDQPGDGSRPTCLIADRSGNVWIGTTGGILLFNPQQGVFRDFMGQSTQGLLSDNHIACLFLDRENIVWIGTRNGLNRMDPVDFYFTQFFPGGSPASRTFNDIRSITGNEHGELILATTAGIIRFNPASRSFTAMVQPVESIIHTLAVDSSGILWGGTDNGMLKIRHSKLSFAHYNTNSGEFRLNNDLVVSLGGYADNKLLIGYAEDQYALVDLKNRRSATYKTFGGASVVNFYPFRSEAILVLTQHDVEIFDPEQNSRIRLISSYPFLRSELLESARLNCLVTDGTNSIWLGTDDGIQHIRLDSARHVKRQALVFQGQQISIGQVFDMKLDASGNLWLGTDRGLLFYNPVKGNFRSYTPYDKNLMNTERKSVYTLILESDDMLWIGTSHGVFRFDVNNREFSALDYRPEIMHATIRAMDLDPMNNLWLGTERGLYCYQPGKGSWQFYDRKEGLPNLSYSAIYADADSQLYLAGAQGLSVINLRDYKTESRIAKVAITGLRFVERDPSEDDLLFQVSDTIVLPWNRKPLWIEFALSDMTRPEFNRYRYSFGKIGRKTNWYPLGTQHHVILDNLAPGKYQFRVVGANSHNEWNNTGADLVIVVNAPFWRSTVSLLFYILLGAILLFLFIRFWIRQFFNLSRENLEREMFGKQIMLQKEELALKNKSITDSINYAKRIQTAMLPPYKMFKSIFPSSFILFMPKDIVSGDFYWVNKLNNKIFISAVDCTGHGVPGAFMSIIGFELFRKITNIEGLSRPSDILNRLNEDFHVIFKDVENVVLRDGMDVAFCSIDKKDMILEFAGAFNPLYLIRDNKITEVKGDRFAIGLDETNFKDQTFKNHIIPIQKGDIIYIFSDGFADQFGGPDGKKYKYRRFRHLLLTLHQLPMEKQHEILENNVLEWRGEQDQVDDILVIGIKIDF